MATLDSYFQIKKRKSSVGQEVRGGLVTYLTMVYIVVLNPLILGFTQDINGKFLGGGDGPNLAAIAAATALIAGILTILMGAVANFPLALATGLGINAFVARIAANYMTWEQVMGLVVLEGILITIAVLTGFRVAIFKAIPTQLKLAISVGIGLFIALIGLVDAGFVRRTQSGPVPVELGAGGNLVGWPVVVFIFGLLLISFLYARKTKGAILIGVLSATVLAVILESVFKIGPLFTAPDKVNPSGWNLNVPAIPSSIIATPDFGLLGRFDLFGGFATAGFMAAALLVFTLLITDFFDTMGTMTAIGAEAGLADRNGNVENADRILLVDSIAAMAGGAGGVSSNTSYIESASGVGEGARTGLASIVTGIAFLLTTFLSPLVAIVPYEAATPALLIVGFLMMTQIKDIDWTDVTIALPAFLTIILMPFTYSIAVGIGAGFVTHVVLKVATGKSKTIHPLLWVVAIAFVIYFSSYPINNLLG
ncbi:MAG: NCS2 family permease [Candidatus Nanopelagicales bacterium]|jgi:adenine/guanine/hypoxanthine permease|nr:NCS2 family permease [Candidatus Nanopelagicales bacterium]MDP4746516.1 NCS2 family permease [Candidatus Nanopelagicales bacterium]MDP4986272.1 NCS2 family permease [Candidatus Nanopelagicales bacterium]MDP5108087.1 NCS2 family permease [Candidatus Nanopelagicales bacterium]